MTISIYRRGVSWYIRFGSIAEIEEKLEECV